MTRSILTVAGALFLTSGLAATSVFDGTWRAEYPQKFPSTVRHDHFELRDGTYTCSSCTPPYTVKADGTDCPIKGNPDMDARSVAVKDSLTVIRTAKKSGTVVFESAVTASKDGQVLTELQTIYGMAAHPLVIRVRYQRVGGAPAGAHAISGEWQRLDYDMPNNDEDTTFRAEGDVFSMTDKMGRSFKARLDGTDAPYVGSPEFTSVSVRQVNDHTLEERDKNNGVTVKICTWTITPDGNTIHARFDDTHGHIEKQDGHKLP